MKLEIDSEIINRTVCPDDFACLTDTNHPCIVTKIEQCVNGLVHFIKCPSIDCKHKMHFADAIVCNCPTRKEIYNKYNL